MSALRAAVARWPLAAGVLVLWLTRAVLGWLVLSPLAFAVSASGIGAVLEGDRALFAPGGLWILELARTHAELLSAGLRSAAVLYATCSVACVLPLAFLFSTQARGEAGSVRRTFALVPGFLLIGAAELAALALWLFLALLIGTSAADGVGAFGELAEDGALGVFAVLAVAGVMVLAVFADVARALLARASVRFSPAATLEAARRGAGALAGGFVIAGGAGALLVALVARAVELAAVEREGALRVLAAAALHQASVLALCALQGLWIRRVSRVVSQQRSAHPEHGDRSVHSAGLGDPSSYPGA